MNGIWRWVWVSIPPVYNMYSLYFSVGVDSTWTQDVEITYNILGQIYVLYERVNIETKLDNK